MIGPCVSMCFSSIVFYCFSSTGGPRVVAAFFHAGLLHFILTVHMHRKYVSSKSREFETGPPRLVSSNVSTSTIVWIEGTFEWFLPHLTGLAVWLCYWVLLSKLQKFGQLPSFNLLSTPAGCIQLPSERATNTWCQGTVFATCRFDAWPVFVSIERLLSANPADLLPPKNVSRLAVFQQLRVTLWVLDSSL